MTEPQSSTSTAAPKSRRTLIIVLVVVGVIVVAGLAFAAVKVTGDSSDEKVVPAGQTAKALFSAWESGDETAAAKVATPEAVTELFANAGSEASGLTFDGCGPTGDDPFPKECIWSRPGGELTMTVNKQGDTMTVTAVKLGEAGLPPDTTE